MRVAFETDNGVTEDAQFYDGPVPRQNETVWFTDNGASRRYCVILVEWEFFTGNTQGQSARVYLKSFPRETP